MYAFPHPRAGGRLGLAALVLAIELGVVLAPATLAQAQAVTPSVLTCDDRGPVDYAVPGGWFYTEAASGCVTLRGPDRLQGYQVLDDDRANFWTEFRRYGGVDVLGYPVSKPYRAVGMNDGYWYQAFERGILQSAPTTPPGRAYMAPAFNMFVRAGLEDELEFMGLAAPGPDANGLAFNDDAERRMAWLVDPNFIARYFFDPVAFHSSEPGRPGQSAYLTQEQAWDFFGLPQSMPDRMVLRDHVGGPPLSPLRHSFIGQRFANSGLQLFVEQTPVEKVGIASPGIAPPNSSFVFFDPTIVPGDARNGCVVLTAVGLIARRIGTDVIIPGEALNPEPSIPNPLPSLVAHVPPLQGVFTQNTFELDGAVFAPKEQVDVVLSVKSGTLPTVVVVDTGAATAKTDGTFQLVFTEDVAKYSITATGRVSLKKVGPIGLDLSIPTADLATKFGGGGCTDVGLPVGTGVAPVPSAASPPSRTTTTTTTTTSSFDSSTDSPTVAPQVSSGK